LLHGLQLNGSVEELHDKSDVLSSSRQVQSTNHYLAQPGFSTVSM